MLVCPGVNLLSCRMCWMTSCHLHFPFHIIEAQFPWKQTATKIMNSILVLWASGWSLHTWTMRGAIMTHSGGSDESCPGWHKVRKYLQHGINALHSPTNRFCQWSSPPEALEHDCWNCTNMQWDVNHRFLLSDAKIQDFKGQVWHHKKQKKVSNISIWKRMWCYTFDVGNKYWSLPNFETLNICISTGPHSTFTMSELWTVSQLTTAHQNMKHMMHFQSGLTLLLEVSYDHTHSFLITSV